MAVRGINKVILVGRLGKDPEVRYIPNRGAVANPGGHVQKAGVTNRRGDAGADRMASRGAVRQARGSGRVNILRKGAQVYIEGQLRTRSWEDNGITRYVTEILVKTTGTMQMLGRAAGAQTQPEEAQQFSGQPQPEPQAEAGTKKEAQKRKAVDVRPRSLSLSRNRRRVTMTGFQTISRSDRADCDNRPAPSCAGHHRRNEDERIFQNTSGAA
ncbi:single-stranded DNA-binding protein [Escherichia coli]|uniref:single-stranded DNA-binding protein n=1 Tax=Escherichia coli TaxID=562 RepID=UPI0029D4145D|nr:single-stranded DNA-binding protein [Escherichia coli]